MDSKSLHQFDGENTGHQYPPVTLNDNARLHQGDYHFHYYAAPVERAETPPSPSFNVPFRRDADFVVRGTILTQIERKCEEGGARVALVGFGGVGKSQLAIEYCHRLRERSPDTWVFWVYASNTDRIEGGYREIAEEVKIPGRNDPQANIFELVKKWLRNEKKGKWLLVLDNADNDDILMLPQKAKVSQSSQKLECQSLPLSDYLPQSRNGAVLITTRTANMAYHFVEPRDIIPIDPMAEDDAIELLAKKLNSHKGDTDLKDLATILEFMPLAIVQAAAYISKRAPRCNVRQYIDEFIKSDQARTQLLNHEAGHLRRDRDAENSIITTWQISFDYIREMWPSSADLLSLMSFFDRQGIPEHVLRAKSQKGEGVERAQSDADHESAIIYTDEFETDLGRLRDYSFVTVEADGHTFAMHRLVQLATRTWLGQHGQDTKQKTLFLRKLNMSFPRAAYEKWTQCEALFPHAKAAEEQPPDHSKNDRSVRDWAAILNKAGGYASARGNYTEAERMCNKSIKALEGGSEQDDIEISYSRGMLATVYWRLGRWTEAEELSIQVMETRKRILGLEHRSTLTSISNLASTYREQARWAEAEELQVQVTETRKRILRPEHPSTLISMNNLASTFQEQGRWREAEELQVQVTEIRKRVLGLTHPSTLISMNNLASTYQKQGRWREAEDLKIQVMETRKTVLGPEHPDTLSSMNNLALTYKEQGRWAEAEELGMQVMEIEKRILGLEHPDTLTTVSNLASTYRDQGRWTEAEKLEVQVLETYQRVLGPDHPDTLSSISNLASTYWSQGRWEEAEKLDLQVMETRKRVLGLEHPDTLTSMGSLASTYWTQKRWTEAEELEAQVVETRKRVLGLEHPDTLASMNNLASVYRDQGRWTEAEKLEVQVAKTCKRVLGPEHPTTMTSIANLATIYWRQGQWAEAEELDVQMLETSKRVLGPEHPDTLARMSNLAFTLKHRQRDDEAIALMASCQQLCMKRLGPTHHQTQATAATLMEWQRPSIQQREDGSRGALGAEVERQTTRRSLLHRLQAISLEARVKVRSALEHK